MRLTIHALATPGPDWADAACAEYLKRLPKHWKTRVNRLAPARRQGQAHAAHWQARDSERIRAQLNGRETLILLDERGRRHDSRGFADRVAHWDDTFAEVAMIIGGPDGHDDALRGQAQELVSLSPLTFPHALARVVLLEQLYRASTIRAGHPYHRDG